MLGQLCWPVGPPSERFGASGLISIGKLEIPVVALKPTVFFRKSPSAVEIVNTGIVDGALTAESRMSRRATPPASLQLSAICANSVGLGRSRLSARQIRPLVAAGKSVSTPPPFGTKTKFAVIFVLMFAGVGLAFEVVDQVTRIQCVTGEIQAVMFDGCGPPPRTSTVFWAARGAMPTSNMLAHKNISFLIGFPSWSRVFRRRSAVN